MSRPFRDYDNWDEIIEALRADEEEIRRGGGEKAVERQHSKGRLTVRERLEKLIDPDSDFFELGIYAGYEMYPEAGGAPASGTLTGIAPVGGRLHMIVANDATVKAGAFFPVTVKKVLRAQRIAMQNRLPLIYLVDSAGVYLPMQDEIFPDQDDFGRIFRNNAKISARGIPQIAAIMGPCVAGGAYLPVMSDKILMVEGSGLYIAGPSLVKAAIGQDLNSEELGGADLHAELSGTIDFKEADDEDCLKRLRKLAAQSAEPERAPFNRQQEQPPKRGADDLFRIMPIESSGEYDMREVFECIFDDSQFEEYKKDYGRTVLCGYAHVGGWSVGVVANQKTHIRQPGKQFEVGGVIYREAADKAARFIMDCNQNRLPLLFFQDVNGFMVGRDAEVSGIIKSGAKMVNAVANSVVPKITVITGGSFGAGNYALCGKAYDPRFIFAWPTCQYAVMGGSQAAKTLADLKVRQMAKQGQEIDEEERQRIVGETSESYQHQMDARYAAARLWVDRIIDPRDTREAIKLSLDVASLNARIKDFKVGVFQV
ncbi:MAG TPA: acyl-CoA carboxylase subunit beta [Acidobacteriota bacterium]|nr:acyl-CoA carboxylase subunit beta [Acidobacteriota bacterium]